MNQILPERPQHYSSVYRCAGSGWRWHLVLRGADPVTLLDGGLEPPWSVDVDPESLL